MPKILWMSPFSLHDTSSGGAVNSRYMLKSLYKHGWEVWACSSFIFEAKNGSEQAFGDLEQMFAHDPNKVFIFDEDNIHFVYTRAAKTSEFAMTLNECQLFFQTFRQVLTEFQPDVVMGYGITPVAQTCFAEAKHRGIATVYLVSHGSYNNFFFPNVDLIVTDSHATMQLYAERDEINMVPVGAFFDLKAITAPEHVKRYVTMINPSEPKGGAIMAKIAKACQTQMPEVEFLTVNTKERFIDLVGRLHVKGEPDQHPYRPSDFPNVFMVDPQMDIRPIYAVTSVLLVPSLWFEAWGRVASEAVFNNIPVIASTSGGLSEATAGGGFLIEPPLHCLQDYLSIPTDEEIQPWLDALSFLLHNDVTPELKAAQRRLSQENATLRLLEALEPLVEQTQNQRLGNKPRVIQINDLSNSQIPDVSF